MLAISILAIFRFDRVVNEAVIIIEFRPRRSEYQNFRNDRSRSSVTHFPLPPAAQRLRLPMTSLLLV